MRHLTHFGFAAVLVTLAGCDFGTLPAEVASDPTPSLALGEWTPLAIPGTPDLTDPAPPAAPEPAPSFDESQASALVPASPRPASQDCIDFSSGSFRLAPCTLRLSTTNPIGHDDPDPWRAAPTLSSR